MNPISVLIVDDHAVVRQGLRAYLGLHADIDVVAEAGSAEHGAALAARWQPQVALVDLVMPGADGIEATRAIRRVSPDTLVLILTSSDDTRFVRPALEAGAIGYQLKEISGPELLEAVRRTARAQSSVHPRMVDGLARSLRDAPSRDPMAQLSQREREVLLLIAEGLSNLQIAERLAIGEKTVKTHVGNILAKLGLVDRTQVAVWAWRHRLPDAAQQS